MKLVIQKDRSGCGLACVAMLAGVGYDTVRGVWIDGGGDPWLLKAGGNGAGLTTDEIDSLLVHFGVVHGIWDMPRIVRIEHPEYDFLHHLVVIDRDGIVFDPDP